MADIQQERRKPGERGDPPPLILTDQLTLSQPGGQIMPTTLLPTPKFSDLPTALIIGLTFFRIALEVCADIFWGPLAVLPSPT